MSRRKLFYRRRHGAIPEAKRSDYAAKIMDAHGSAHDTKGNVCSRPMRLETAQRIAGCLPLKVVA